MIDRDELAADLTRIHGIRIEADDPVLTAALLNQRLLDEAIGRLETAVRTSADRMTAAAAQQVDGAKEMAASFVTRAGEWSAERLRTAAEEAARALLVEVRREATRAERACQVAVRVAWVLGGLGTIAFAGVAGFLLAWVGQR